MYFQNYRVLVSIHKNHYNVKVFGKLPFFRKAILGGTMATGAYEILQILETLRTNCAKYSTALNFVRYDKSTNND